MEGFHVGDATPLKESPSGKAILFDAVIFDEPEWIPKSGIHDDSEVWKVGQDTGTLVVETWVAEKKGW
jgi:hypothetical protein